MSIENTDIDPVETQEWLDALASVVKHEGNDRAAYLLTQHDQDKSSVTLQKSNIDTAYIVYSWS